jgi:Tol biopolymer transport system component
MLPSSLPAFAAIPGIDTSTGPRFPPSTATARRAARQSHRRDGRFVPWSSPATSSTVTTTTMKICSCTTRSSLGVLSTLLAAAAASAAAPAAELVNRTGIAAHIDADGSASGPFGVSTDGRFVIYASRAGNLVAGDINGRRDLFVHDRTTGVITKIDTGDAIADEVPITGTAGVSGDGRFVVFGSRAAALVNEPTYGVGQAYRLDRSTGTVTLLSRGLDGLAGGSPSSLGNISADGRFSVFSSFAANLTGGTSSRDQIYVHDANSGALRRVSVTGSGTAGNGNSNRPQISADGRYVLFMSEASDLIAGDTNFREDLFLHDLQLGTTQRASVSTTGAQLAEPSPVPGVRFFSLSCSLNNLSADGRFVIFASATAIDPSDTNHLPDVYRFDRISGTTQRISADLPASLLAYNQCPTIAADGQRVAWLVAGAGPAGPVFEYHVRDDGNPQQLVLSHATPESPASDFSLALSGDGNGLFFANGYLTPESRHTYVFRVDTTNGDLERVSTTPPSSYGPYANDHSNDFSQGAGNAVSSSVSADGRYVAFASQASNLVVGDTNGVADIFVRDRRTGTTQRISRRADGLESDCASGAPTISTDASTIVFVSCGALAAPATGTQQEIYRYSLATGAIELVSVAANGARADKASSSPHVSADGHIVAFASCATDLTATPLAGCHAYVRDMSSSSTMLISRNDAGEPAANPPNGRTQSVRVSGSGRFVVYASAAPNLVADDTNNNYDAFVHDRDTATTRRASVASDGSEGNASAFPYGVSDDGERIVFTSDATNLATDTTPARIRVYLRDRTASTTRVLAIPGDAEKTGGWPFLSTDGLRVVFINATADSGMSAFDDRGRAKLFLFDDADDSYRALTWYAAPAAPGATEAPRLSADGRYVVFNSTRTDLDPADGNGAFTDVFLIDLDEHLFADGFEPSR